MKLLLFKFPLNQLKIFACTTEMPKRYWNIRFAESLAHSLNISSDYTSIHPLVEEKSTYFNPFNSLDIAMEEKKQPSRSNQRSNCKALCMCKKRIRKIKHSPWMALALLQADAEHHKYTISFKHVKACKGIKKEIGETYMYMKWWVSQR